MRQAVGLKNFCLLLKQLLVPSDLYETCTRQWNECIDYYIVKIVRSVKLANTISTKAGRDLVSGS